MVSAFPLSLSQKILLSTPDDERTHDRGAQLAAPRVSAGPLTCLLLLLHIISGAYSSETERKTHCPPREKTDKHLSCEMADASH